MSVETHLGYMKRGGMAHPPIMAATTLCAGTLHYIRESELSTVIALFLNCRLNGINGPKLLLLWLSHHG